MILLAIYKREKKSPLLNNITIHNDSQSIVLKITITMTPTSDAVGIISINGDAIKTKINTIAPATTPVKKRKKETKKKKELSVKKNKFNNEFKCIFTTNSKPAIGTIFTINN